MNKYILTPTGRKLLTESDGKNTFDVDDEVYTEFGKGIVVEKQTSTEKPYIKVKHTHIASEHKPGDSDFQEPIKVLTVLPITTRKEMLPFKSDLVPIKK